MTVQVNITGLETIAASIDQLAKAISGQRIVTTVTDKTTNPPALAAPVAPPITPPVQTIAPPPVTQSPATQIPAAQIMPAPAPVSVPTTTQSYTLDDIARAAMILMDSGRQGDLLGLLASFGVDALPALPQAQYGAFATALRGMGAQI